MNTDQEIMDDDEMRVIQRNKTCTHYVLQRLKNTTEYAMEFD